MRKWGEKLVEFIITDSESQTRNHLAEALVNSEGFSVARADLESKEFLQLCKTKDLEALRGILETGIPTLRLHAAIELARSNDLEAIRPLLRSLESTRTDKNSKAHQAFRGALGHLIHQMASVPQPEHLSYYLDLLRWQKRYRLPIGPLVNAITVIAETWPTPELQEALPLLKNHPKARQAIEATLLPGARFPIPAERPSTTENLPRPAPGSEEAPTAELLPLPSDAPTPDDSNSLLKRLRKRILPWH